MIKFGFKELYVSFGCKMNKLFEDDQSDEEINFKTNKDYAKSYNKYRQKELLKKCKSNKYQFLDHTMSML